MNPNQHKQALHFYAKWLVLPLFFTLFCVAGLKAANPTLSFDANITVADECDDPTTATVTTNGGVAPFTYHWDNGATTATVTGLAPGFHCVTVTDNNGDDDVACIDINGELEIIMDVKGLACFNFCDASVEAIVTGGQPPYSYNWSNGATGSVNPNLGPGTYSVTVTDQNGCTITGSANVGNPNQIIVTVNVTNPICGAGGTGSATAVATGGAGPFTYYWNFGAIGQTVTGLIPGSYSVTAVDFVGCTGSVGFAIIPQSSINLSVSATPSSACGTPTGSATVVISGGTGPFDVDWSNGGTTETINNLVPGTYSVSVTDINGCGAMTSVTVGGTPAIDLNITGVSAGCAANGSATAMVTPGTGTAPFSYLWNTNATTPVINNLVAGTYSVTVTDANNCTATDQVTVSGSSNINVTTTTTPVSCFTGSNGTATAIATGATGTVTYQWSNGSSSQTITNLPTGTYFVTVTDQASGCTAFTSAFVSQPTQVNVSVTPTNAVCNTLGSATAAASGGTAPYTYAWSNGVTGATNPNLNPGNYVVTATDFNGCIAIGMTTVSSTTITLSVTINLTHPISAVGANDGAVSTSVSGGTAPYSYLWNTGATTSGLSNLGPGTYTVTVTSSNGCTGTSTITLYEPSCIGDRVWMDMDRDGCQDPGPAEFGVANVTVTLTGTTLGGASVNMTTTTASNGYYIFDNLQPGTYQVQFTAPTGFLFSPSNACSDDFSDSDANASGNTGNIVLPEGNCKVTVDAGIYDECLNVTDPGTICCDQILCGPGNDAAPINSVTPATGGGSPTQYMWMYSTVPGPFNPNTWYTAPGNNMGASYDPGVIYETTYFVRCTKAQNCDDWKESNIVVVEIGDDAVAEIDGPDLVCVGDPTTYSATSNGPGATYAWNFGAWASPSTSTSQNPTVTWNTAGVVYITLTVTANGCTSTAVMGVAISNNPIICGNGLVININDMSNAVMVEWDVESLPSGTHEFVVQRSANGTVYENLGTLQASTDNSVSHYAFADYFPKKGNSYYRVEVRESGIHKMFSNSKLVQRFATSENFMIYPSPVTDFMTIEATGDMQGDVNIEVLSMQGKLLEKMKVSGTTLSQTINLGHLQSGTYLLRFRYNNGQREVIKFVKG